MSAAHPGFKAAAASISAKEGIPAGRARAILAASARKSSLKARKANPRLNKVGGIPKPKNLRQLVGK